MDLQGRRELFGKARQLERLSFDGVCETIKVEKPFKINTITCQLLFDVGTDLGQLRMMEMVTTDGFRTATAFDDASVQQAPFEITTVFSEGKNFPNVITIRFFFSPPTRTFVTIKLARTGNVHIAGATQKEDIDRVEEFCKKAYRFLLASEEFPRVTSFVVNMVSASMSIDHNIHMPTAYAKTSKVPILQTTYEPGSHSGIRVKVADQGGMSIVFRTGAIVFTGFRDVDHLEQMYRLTMLILDDARLHSTIGVKRRRVEVAEK